MAHTLLHLGGDRLQLPTLRWAREAGLHVALADPDADAPGARLAQRTLVAQPDDAGTVAAHARELETELGPLAVHTARRTWLATAAAVEEALADLRGEPALHAASMRRALDPGAAARRLQEAGIPIGGDAHAGWEVNAFFRDGAFVPAGVLQRVADARGAVSHGLMAAGIAGANERELYTLVERAARALGLDHGPVGAVVRPTSEGMAVAEVLPCFHRAETTSLVAPLVLGKSPAQAWFATLVDAGGPFDAMPDAPDEPCAGWLAIRAERPGVLAEVDGVEAARRAAGIAGVSILARPGDALPGPHEPRSALGVLWATGWDAPEVEARLLEARGRLSVRLAA
jgi:hypothetical protein